MRTPLWKIVLYSLVIIWGLLVALPNVMTPEMRDKMPTWLPHKAVTLGLDLRGGAHLVLEVDSKELIKEKVDLLLTDTRSILRDEKLRAKTVRIIDKKVVVAPLNKEDGAKISAALRKMNAGSGFGFGQSAPFFAFAELPNGDIEISLTEDGIKQQINNAVDQSLEIVRNRIDEVGVAEPTIQKIGSDRILVQLPGVQDSSRIRDLLGSTAKMSFHLMADGGAAVVYPDADGTGHTYSVRAVPALGGEHLVDAQATLDPQSGKPTVSFRFDSTGARIFGRVTQENLGKPFAIVLDKQVLSAPVIQSPILGGSGVITGNFTMQEAVTLSALLRAGALPAPLTVIEERTVGPDQGSDAIEMGLKTGLMGFALVFLFMLALYGRWGLIANIALALNVILTFAFLTLLGATLTLPGIAGIILGIGLAVDANVLINERIREEIRGGKTALAAVNAGFDRAYATIIDSNVTALIATILLFQFGTGPVKGFAITMAIGIAVSMFTAVTVVRVIMNELVARRKAKNLEMKPPLKWLAKEPKFHYMRARFFGIAVSLILSVASICLFIKPGLNYGVDFLGGIQIEMKSQNEVDLGAMRSALDALNLGEVTLQEIGDKKSVLIRAQRQEGGEEAQSAAVNAIKEAVVVLDETSTIERTEVVGPKVSGELAASGVMALVLATICMLFYIWWRFEWPFAVGAIVTLILDVTKTIGFFVITGLDFNLTAIAAILTLVGYTVNDKVVVYDRIRENMRKFKNMPFSELIDLSINQTLARSLYTSVTALLAMLPMAIWGGSAVSSFAIPMVFGIIIAASSSVFIAAPILLFLGDWRQARRKKLAMAGLLVEDTEEVTP
jgi:SecD/SecF fusion protein